MTAASGGAESNKGRVNVNLTVRIYASPIQAVDSCDALRAVVSTAGAAGRRCGRPWRVTVPAQRRLWNLRVSVIAGDGRQRGHTPLCACIVTL